MRPPQKPLKSLIPPKRALSVSIFCSVLLLSLRAVIQLAKPTYALRLSGTLARDLPAATSSKSLYALGDSLFQTYPTTDVSAVGDTFRNTLAEKSMAGSSAVLDRVLSGFKNRTEEAKKAKLHDKRRYCEKDYTGSCPEGWNKRKGTSNMCTAPASYTGPCSMLLRASVEKTEKATLENMCRISWPCLDYCERDFSSLCPLGWNQTPGSFCRAPADYSDRCERQKDFTHFTPDLKIAWSQSCNVLWPCKRTCASDFSAPCPTGWSLIESVTDGRICRAPPDYSGACGPEEAISDMDSEFKAMFEAKCNVKFPCAKQSCTRDYGVLCPDGWFAIVDDGSCQAPDSYTGKCDTKLFMMHLQKDEKTQKETECGVTWPCIEPPCGAVRYQAVCPKEWIPTKIKTREGKSASACAPSASYKGPCSGTKVFEDKTPEMKAAFETNCKVTWACPEETLVKGPLSTHAAKVSTKHLKYPSSGINGPYDVIEGRTIDAGHIHKAGLNAFLQPKLVTAATAFEA